MKTRLKTTLSLLAILAVLVLAIYLSLPGTPPPVSTPIATHIATKPGLLWSDEGGGDIASTCECRGRYEQVAGYQHIVFDTRTGRICYPDPNYPLKVLKVYPVCQDLK